MSNINNKLDYLDETKQLIKQAIIDKGQEVSDEDTFRSYVDKISDIETGDNTKDATATSNDILYPETAYISNGKVTGNIMPTYSSNTTLSQTNTISRSLSYSLLDINYDAKIAIVSEEDYKFNFCNIVNNEIDYENSAYITLNDFEEGMDGTYSFSKCCTNFDKNTNDLYLYLLFTFQNTFKVFCYIYNIKTKSSKYIDTYELTIDDANNSLVLNMMIRPNYPNQVIVFCGYTSTTALGSYLTTVFLQFNTVALELQKIEDTISTSSNQYAAKVESCYFTSNGEYLCINVRTGTLSGTTQNGVIYHCVNNFLESIVDSTRYITLFENGNYMAYNQSTRNHCLFNVNGDILYSYSGNLGEVSTEQLTYTNKCILGNYLFGFAYPEDFINPTEPLILYCCKLNEDYTIIKEYEISVGSRTLFNCYNAILYDNKTTRNFDGYLGDIEKEIISLERNNTTYFSTKDSTADENDILSPKTAYSNGKKIIGNILTTYDNRNDNISVNTSDIAKVEACEYLYKENIYILGKEQMYILKHDNSSISYSFENDIEGNIIRITSCYINNHTIIAVLTTSGEKQAYIYFYEMNSDKTLNYLTKLEFTSERFYENQMTLRISNKNILAYTIRNRNKGSNYYFYQLKYEDNFSIELISQGVIGSGEIDFYTGKWSKDSTKYIILGQDYRYTGIFNLDNKGTVIDTEVSNLFYYFDFHTDDKVCYVNNNILSYCSYTYPFTFEPIFSINVTNNDWLNIFVLKDWCILYGKTKVQIYKIEANKFVHLYEFDSYYARLKDLNQINDKVYNLNKSTKALTVLYGEGISVIDSVTIKDKVLYNTDLADATMNDVLQGKIFYNSEGKQIGNKIFTDYNDSVGILETNSAISATAVDQLIGVEMTISPDIEYLDKVKVNDIVKAVITIIDVATSSATLKCNCLVQILEIIDHSDKQFKANVRILAADVNTEDGTATSEDIAEGKIAYVNNKRVHGTMPNNNELNYIPSDQEQVIPKGYTSGGIIQAINYTNTLTPNEYTICNKLASAILYSESKLPEYYNILLDLENCEDTLNSNASSWIDSYTYNSISIINGQKDTDNTLLFNGRNTYFDTNIPQKYLSSGYSIILRVKPSTWTNYKGIFGIHTDNKGIVGIQYSNGNITYSHKINENDKYISLSSSDIPVNSWTTIIITSNEICETNIYINGDLKSTITLDTLLPLGNIIVGKAFDSYNRNFKGNISHIIIYNKELSYKDVQDINNYVEGGTI